MNPYLPPQCEEPAAKVAELPVMQVKYGLGHSLGMIFSASTMILGAIRADAFAPPWVLFSSGAFFLVAAVVTWGKVFFEVFEDRIEMVPPFFSKRGRRHPKPLEVIDSRSLLFRFWTKRSDFKRFIAWRDSRRG
ncbi:MAG TPA: hypothetical protein VGE67_01135 [Haloferula sp.]